MNQEELIKACIKGSPEAQMILYEQYSPILRGVSYRYVREVSDLEDIVQDSFIKILSSIKKFDSKGSFDGWLKRIAINTAISFLRKEKRLPKAELSDSLTEDDNVDLEKDQSQSEKLLSEKELTQDEIMIAISRLPDDYRVVFNMYVFENYKHKEIAELLNIRENTSKSKLMRARKLVQDELIKMKTNR